MARPPTPLYQWAALEFIGGGGVGSYPSSRLEAAGERAERQAPKLRCLWIIRVG